MAELQLANGGATLVDDDIAETLRASRWVRDKKGYARRGYVRGRIQLLHRLVLSAPPGVCVDHIDRNRLNNCRSNLRLVTPTESNLNRGRSPLCKSRFRGVSWQPSGLPWQVYLNRKYIGRFGDELAAAQAWIDAALPVYGAQNIALDIERLAQCAAERGSHAGG